MLLNEATPPGATCGSATSSPRCATTAAAKLGCLSRFRPAMDFQPDARDREYVMTLPSASHHSIHKCASVTASHRAAWVSSPTA
jgi:hypothetical protein